jgi:HK97 gp10 family phage protein
MSKSVRIGKTASGIELEGADYIDEMLGEFAPRIARNINRATILAVAGEVGKVARRLAPKDEGVLKKAIKWRSRRAKDPDRPFADVYITRGKSQRYNAWYWHFVEKGTVKKEARPFIEPAIQEIKPRIGALYKEHFFKKVEQTLVRELKKRGKK